MMKLALSLMLAVALPTFPAGPLPTLKMQPETLKLPDGKEIVADIGRLEVPENRSRANSNSIELAVVRLRSQAAKAGSPIVYLAGGPGNSTTGLARDPRSLASFAALTSLADVILIDQRSTGRSTPLLRCSLSTVPAPDVVFTDSVRNLQGLRDALVSCAAEWRSRGADLAGYNTNENADDLESLRLALGAPKLILIGFSYGTHLALATIRRHGAFLDRVILIGTEGPDHTLKLPRSTDTQIEKLSLLAAANPAIGKEVPDMGRLLRELLVRLDREPIVVTVQNRQTKEQVKITVGGFGLRRILASDLGDGNDFPQFPAMVKMMAGGDYSLLSQYVEKRYNQMGRGISLMPFLMDCASGASASRVAQIRSEAPRSIIGDIINYPFPEVCAALGIDPLPDAFRMPIVSDVRTLFISGTLDNNTPPYQAEEVRWGLMNATHLIVENAGHEDTLPNPDVQRAITDFLRGEDVSARRIVLRRPKFLSLEEARRFKLE